MPAQDIRPKWWQLYLIFPIFIGLFAMDARLILSTRGHQIFQIGVILLICELVHLWLKANARALSAMDRAQFSGKIKVIRFQPNQLPAQGNEDKKRPMFRLPSSEIKGALSQTFEIDYIDAESVSPPDEVHEN